MKVYSGFGYFSPTKKTALYEISLPAVVNSPGDNYNYTFVNISTSTNNGLLIFVKRTSDAGTDLSGYKLNHEAVPVDLKDVPLFAETATNLHAADFVYSKNFAVITYHECNAALHQSISKQLFLSLDSIVNNGVIAVTTAATTVVSGPGKHGLGTLKQM